MAQENVEVVKRVEALLHASDIDGALACFDREVEWRAFAPEPGASTSGQGIDSLRAHWVPLPEDTPDEYLLGVLVLMTEVGEYVDRGAYVVCVGKDVPDADVYEFTDGKIIRATFGHPSKAHALKAVGLAE